MNGSIKKWLIAAFSLILIGLFIFGGVMTMLKWDFKKLSTVKYETKLHEVTENYKSISIVTNTADIVFVPAEDGETTVTCYEQKKVTHTVSVVDGTLVIDLVDTRKWYGFIGLDFDTPKLTVALPAGEYGTLSVKSSTGRVTLPEDFQWEDVDISVSTGDVVCRASSAGDVYIKTTTGDVCVEDIKAEALLISVSTGKVTVNDTVCAGDVTLTVSTGKGYLTNVSCQSLISDGSTGSLSLTNVVAKEKFSLKRSTGDITLDGCDAAEFLVETDTGDVTGTLLSEKVFLPRTDTGRIDVPKTTTGGRCEITTDTGDIKISLSR